MPTSIRINLRSPALRAAAAVGLWWLIPAAALGGDAPSHADCDDAMMVAASMPDTLGQSAPIAPQFVLHGFSDVTAVGMRSSVDGRRGTFALGQMDLFIVSRLAPNLSFLGETVFELDGAETAADVERIFVKYKWSDQLRLSVGRTHTALGFWNEAYHHGRLFQPTVERPQALKFEDGGGILPVHSVGVELSGAVHSGVWDLSYSSNLANGRGPTREEVQGGQDANNHKAVALKLVFGYDGAVRASAGPMFYRDRIPANPGVAGRENPMDEEIEGAHVHIEGDRAEMLGEAYWIRHRDRVSSVAYDHRAGYALLLLKTGRLKPYGGAERIDVADAEDPYYAGDTDLTRGTAGLRWEVSSFNAIKLEFRHDRRPGESRNGVLAQTAFTF